MASHVRSLRGLPAVETLLQHPALAVALASHPRRLVVDAVRAELRAERARLTSGGRDPAVADELARRAAARAEVERRPSLRRVVNATGVVLHTNLGRAPLAPAALAAVADTAGGYCSLELDLDTGRRGERGTGIERWLTRLTGAEAGMAVNNGAGAILLVLSAIASGRQVIVSRGELVEIGGSFRVPDVMEKSGARLLEVGTTNRTHLGDYQRALDRHGDVGAILRVHPSNFRIQGFTTRPPLEDLARLAHRAKLPLIEDLGSGALVDLEAFGIAHEPTAGDSLRAGCDVVTFSGDKLLGGAQAGLIIGRRRWIDRVRKDPLARALRLDKLALAALEATLPFYADPERAAEAVPALAMLRATPEALNARARRLASALEQRVKPLEVRVMEAEGEVGGGSLPLERLPGWVVELRHPEWSAQDLERRARAAEPPVLGTLRRGAFRLDPRTFMDGDETRCVEALATAFATQLGVDPTPRGR
jgi:L-seryl-tRNA(Ser) seleniumtransferase